MKRHYIVSEGTVREFELPDSGVTVAPAKNAIAVTADAIKTIITTIVADLKDKTDIDPKILDRWAESTDISALAKRNAADNGLKFVSEVED